MYDYKWNIGRAGKYLGLHHRLSTGFVNHHLVDQIQRLTQDWYEEPLFPSWQNTLAYKDNGERFGLLSSTISDEADDYLDQSIRKHKSTEKSRVVRVSSIHTDFEVNFFFAHIGSFIEANQRFRADLMTEFWNKEVSKQEDLSATSAGSAVTSFLYRKTEHMLNHYFTEYNVRLNQSKTMRGSTPIASKLRVAFRPDMLLQMPFPPALLPSITPREVPLPSAVPVASMSAVPAPVVHAGSSDGKRKRAPQTCQDCGHFKSAFGLQHLGRKRKCTLHIKSPQLIRPEREKVHDSRRNTSKFDASMCLCVKCVAVASF